MYKTSYLPNCITKTLCTDICIFIDIWILLWFMIRFDCVVPREEAVFNVTCIKVSLKLIQGGINLAQRIRWAQCIVTFKRQKVWVEQFGNIEQRHFAIEHLANRFQDSMEQSIFISFFKATTIFRILYCL